MPKKRNHRSKESWLDQGKLEPEKEWRLSGGLRRGGEGGKEKNGNCKCNLRGERDRNESFTQRSNID